MLSADAADALTHYDISVAEAFKMDTLWNTMIRIRSGDDRTYALRLCNPLVDDVQMVREELKFIRHVITLGHGSVPLPVQNLQGEDVTLFFTDGNPGIACLFDWIGGEPVRGRVSADVARHLGTVTALLHKAAKDYCYPVAGDGVREACRWDEGLVLSHHEWINEKRPVIGKGRADASHGGPHKRPAALSRLPQLRDQNSSSDTAIRFLDKSISAAQRIGGCVQLWLRFW